MQDRELVAAVAAGDADGLAEIYDRYAEPLYTYCRFMLPDLDPMGSAAQAVQDTFIIAAAKLSGLSEPDRLRAWLHAVARNECLRQLGAADGVPARPAAGSAAAFSAAGSSAPDDVMPAVTLPDDLRTKVLAACADSTPTGRAYRVSVTHRAGTFGGTGFPKPAVPSGPRWWHDLRRRPRAAAAVAAAAGAVVLGDIVALLMLGGSPRTPSSPVALGGGVPTAGSSAVSSGPAASPAVTARQTTSAPPTPADGPTLGPASPSGKATAATPASSPTAPSPSPSGSPPASSPASSPSSPPASPPSSPPPAQGRLTVTPASLKLTATAGTVARGAFRLGAVGGPVSHWQITVPAAMASKVTLSRSSGSLASGDWVAITVSVRSKVALGTRLTVSPGDLTVTVVLTI